MAQASADGGVAHLHLDYCGCRTFLRPGCCFAVAITVPIAIPITVLISVTIVAALAALPPT